MAIVTRADAMVTRQGPGFVERVFADADLFGRPVPMVGRRLELEPGAELAFGDEVVGEFLLYVAAGSGWALLDSQTSELATETTLLLGRASGLVIRAGDEGIDFLLATAS